MNLHVLKNLFWKLITPAKTTNWLSDVLMTIPRFIAGGLLAFDFGSSKFGMPWTDPEKNLGILEVASWFPEDVADFGMPFSLAPHFFAWMGAASEAIGGLLLMAGLFTRVSSFLVACTMLVAIFFQKWDGGTWGMLPAMGFLWMSIYNMIYGSSRLGLDYLLVRVKKPQLNTAVLAASLIFLGLTLGGCGSTSTISIKAGEEFVLGEQQSTAFRVRLKNLSKETVEVKAVLTANGDKTQGFGLAGKGNTTVYVSRNENVILSNRSDRDVKVDAKLSKLVEGMRYQPVGE